MAANNNRQVVLITGANTGIGLAIVKGLCASAKASYDIILGSRSVSNGEAAASEVRTSSPNTTSKITVAQIDIASDDSITQLVAFVKSAYGKLDVLINNAGASFSLDPSRDNGLAARRALWNRTWDVNVTGSHLLAEELTPLLIKSTDPRLLFLTSGTACLTDHARTDGPLLGRINASPYAGWPKEKAGYIHSYRVVKTGLNMLMREWVRTLKNDGVKVWAISPGFLATGLGGTGEEARKAAEMKKAMGAGDAQEGGDFIVDVVEGRRDEQVGLAIRKNEVQQW